MKHDDIFKEENMERIGKYGGGYVQFLDPALSNSDENSRIAWTTSLAAISRGKDKSANPEKRYAALMKEAEGNKPSRPFEFLPIILEQSDAVGLEVVDEQKAKNLIKFSHIDTSDDIMYTNMRAVISADSVYKNIPYVSRTVGFAAFKVKAPMFVWAQIVTHTQLSTESQSDRVAEEQDYWLPDDIEERLLKLDSNDKFIDEVISKVYNTSVDLATLVSENALPTKAEGFESMMINSISQRDVQLLLKALGYPREIWSRAPYYFKMKEFVITGWANDDNAWPHFLRERNAYMDDGGPKNWTQPETQKYAFAIRKLLEDNGVITKEQVLGGA